MIDDLMFVDDNGDICAEKSEWHPQSANPGPLYSPEYEPNM